jgi:hypothetical protein
VAAGLLFLALVVSAGMRAQSPGPDASEGSAPPTQLVTVHGVVKNATTDEPLARVLVTVESRFGMGALTDGDGRFEISGVPAGSIAIELAKPGFEDASDPERSMVLANSRGAPHAVTAAANLPDLQFAMRPLNAIRGQIQLSTGDPAEKFRLELMAQSIMDGRVVWRTIAVALSNADGAYRLGGISDGLYAVVTEPSVDGEEAGNLFASAGKSPMVRNGYARTFYPDAREFSGAAHIRLSGGQTAQANFSLKQEPFHLVQALVSGSGLDSMGSNAGGGTVFSLHGLNLSVSVALNGMRAEVLDRNGHELPYSAQYDSPSHMVQAMLPDGDYTLRITGLSPRPTQGLVSLDEGSLNVVRMLRANESLAGQADVSVNGHAVGNLRISLGPESSPALETIVNRTNTQAPQPAAASANGNSSANGGGGIFITASQAGDSTDAMNAQFAQGNIPGTLETQPLAPGSYWVHTSVAQAGLCEASFTAGGANLAREPLVVGQNGSTAPLTLTLRDDCASLKLAVPAAVNQLGESRIYYIYVVPDFESTTELRPTPMPASSFSSYTFDGLTPGPYHVYAFSSAMELPYRDPEAMAALNLQGQAITLSPGATSSLVLEAPAP